MYAYIYIYIYASVNLYISMHRVKRSRVKCTRMQCNRAQASLNSFFKWILSEVTSDGLSRVFLSARFKHWKPGWGPKR